MASTIHFDPSLDDEVAIREFLRGCPVGAAHPWNGDLIGRTNGGFHTRPLGDQRSLISRVDTDALEQGVASKAQSFTRETGDLSRYTVQIQADPFDIPEDAVHAMALTDHQGGNYFDLQVVSSGPAGDLSVCCYNKKGGGDSACTHSGDKHADGRLFHGAHIRRRSGASHSLCAVGYGHKKLKTFVHQAPNVAIIDHPAQVIRVIPCSLAEYDIGNAMLAVIAVVEYSNERQAWRVTPVSSCNVESRVNTGEITSDVRRAVDKARDQVRQARAGGREDARAAPRFRPILAAAGSTADDVAGAASVDPLDYSVARFTEAGLTPTNLPGVDPTADVTFGRGARMHADTESGVNLPCLFGSLKPGHSTNALGKPPSTPFTWAGFRGSLEGSRLAVVTASVDPTVWPQTVGPSCLWAGNVLMILQDSRTGDPGVLINSASRTAAVMAGPCAVVLYRSVAGGLYWYRGVRWPGLFDEVPPFGADVTELVNSRLAAFVGSGGMAGLPFRKAVELADRTVYIDGVPRRVDEIDHVAIPDLVERPEVVVDACAQASVLLTPEDVRSIADRLMAGINAWVDAQAAPLTERMAGLRGAVMDDPDAQKEMRRLVGERRKIGRRVAPLVAAVSGMHSARSGHTKDADINRANRRAAVKANVDKAKAMTREDICEMFCGVPEWLLADVDNRALLDALRACAGSRFLADASAGKLGAALAPHPSCLSLDGETVGALVEYSGGSERNHAMACNTSMAVVDRDGRPSLPFPLFARYCDAPSPAGIDWPNVCDEEPESAIWRILLRGNLSDVPAGRQHGIASSDRQVPFLIVHFMLGIMDSLAGGVSSPDAVEWDDSVPRILRGLMGLVLSVLASGGDKPVSLLWQMVRPGLSLQLPPHDEVWIAAGIVRIMPYTKWPMADVRNKAAQLIAKTLRKGVVDPVVEPLRQQLSVMQAEARANALDAREEQLRYLATVWIVVQRIISRGLDDDSHDGELVPWGQALLQHMPVAVRNVGRPGTACGQVARFVRALASRRVDWGRPFHETVKTLTHVYVKRSGAFGKAKAALLEAMRGGKIGRAEGIRAKMDAKVAELRDLAPLNAAVDVQFRAGLDDLSRLAGDAELKRAPWSVTGNADARANAEALASQIVGEDGARAAAAGTQGKAVASAAQPIASPAVAALTPCGKRAARAISLAASAPHLNTDMILQMAGLPPYVAGLYKDICSMMGWTDRGGAMLEALLENWRDTVKGERAAMEVLMA